MNKILIHAPSLPGTGVFNTEARDSYFQPFIYLREKLRSVGYTLEMSDGNSLQDCAWVWFFDADSVGIKKGLAQCKSLVKAVTKRPQYRNLYRECLAAGMDKQMALFLWEPQSASPANWDPELHKLFPLIFTWHDNLVDNKKYFKINYAQKIPTNLNFSLSKKEKPYTMIIGHKIVSHPLELYTERLKAIRWFEQNHPGEFDLYGIGWDTYYFKGVLSRINRFELLRKLLKPKYTSYRGPVKSKKETYEKYKFAICYENTRDVPGYITEKIFDCFFAGCVPVYLGAPNITDYIPSDTFIDRRDFKTYDELYNYLKNMLDKEYIDYLEAIRRFIKSDKIYPFSAECFADTITNKIINHIK